VVLWLLAIWAGTFLPLCNLGRSDPFMTRVGANFTVDPADRCAGYVSSKGSVSYLLTGPALSIPEGVPRHWTPSATRFQDEVYVVDENDVVINNGQLDLNPQQQVPDTCVAQPTPNLSRVSSFTVYTKNHVAATSFAQNLLTALEDVHVDHKTHQSLPTSCSSFTQDVEKASQVANFEGQLDTKEGDEHPSIHQFVQPEPATCDIFLGFGSSLRRILSWAVLPCETAHATEYEVPAEVMEVLHHSSTAPPQGNICGQLMMEGNRASLEEDSDEEAKHICGQMMIEGGMTSLEEDSDEEARQPLTGTIDAIYV